jgi:carbamoyltransferase
MKILGIIDGQHDSGACILDNNKLTAAVSEERITRIKLDGGFPYKSIEECFKIANIGPEDIDMIAIGSMLTPPLFARVYRKFQSMEEEVRKFEDKSFKTFLSNTAQFKLHLTKGNPYSLSGKFQRLFLKHLIKKDLPKSLRNKPIKFVDHHLSHAASAFFSSNTTKALAITGDRWGDAVSFAISSCNKKEIKRLFSMNSFDSFGDFYSVMTKYLGFKPMRHEGKILGLSAHGTPEKVNIAFPFKLKNNKLKFTGTIRSNYDIWPSLKKQLKEYSREDISAWLQYHTEELVINLVKEWIGKTKLYDIVLAGGLFANVKLNQRIHELPNVNSVYVFPHMGDGGLAAGACFYINKERIKLNDVYLGAAYENDFIETCLKKYNLSYNFYDNIEEEIAKKLADKKIVARFNGRMEFGPRALGNRSILYEASDPSVNDWLNTRLNRTEFMPFAPATLYEYRDKCYKNLKGAEFTAQFMTITFDCTDYMIKTSPAAVHVDNTARPQLVKKDVNPSYYKIIDEYRKLTSIPTIINTSFNMHEEPIVRTPNDAIDSFLRGHLHYLAIGNFLVAYGE